MTRLLLVEDDEPLLRRMSWILLEAGYQVAAASPFDDLPYLARSHSTQIVIFNTDVAGAKKREHIVALRDACRGILILDIHTLSQGDGDSSHAGGDACLHKPFDADSLIEIVNDWSVRAPP